MRYFVSIVSWAYWMLGIQIFPPPPVSWLLEINSQKNRYQKGLFFTSHIQIFGFLNLIFESQIYLK